VKTAVKTCTGCHQEKPIDQFHKNKATRDGHHYLCRPCNYAKSKTWKSQHPERRHQQYKKAFLRYWNANLLRLYGIGIPEYIAMFREQEGLCACCCDLAPVDRISSLMVDHNHATGVVRGLICHNCNIAIGHLKDDPVKAESVASYLRRSA